MKTSKRLHAAYVFLFCLSGFVMYTSCTFAGAMKFQALLQTHDPRIYVETIEEYLPIINLLMPIQPRIPAMISAFIPVIAMASLSPVRMSASLKS